jgi:hypothetical protein
MLIFGALWSNFWKNIPYAKMKQDFSDIEQAFVDKPTFQKLVTELVTKSSTMEAFLQSVKMNQAKIMEQIRQVTPAAASTQNLISSSPINPETK